MRYLKVKNWAEFQHYKDRNPPWIKLHRALLDDYEFSRLQDASKAHLVLLWLFASSADGQIPEDPKFLQAKLSLDKQPDLQTLIDHGFLIPEHTASAVLADCKQVAPMSVRLEEKRREEKSIDRFEEFWTAYPRKVAKPEALKAWKRLDLPEGDFTKVALALERAKASPQWQQESGKYIPHPTTWLNQRRFEDEVAAPQMKVAMP